MTLTAQAIVKYVWTIQIGVKKSRVCAVYSTYTVTPIPCYLLHAASLVRIGNWSLPSNFSRAKECYEVGWSDFLFFLIFKNWHIAIDWLYFHEFNSKKLANFAKCARHALAAKNHRYLENEVGRNISQTRWKSFVFRFKSFHAFNKNG